MPVTIYDYVGGIPRLPPKLVLPDGQQVDSATDRWIVSDLSYGVVELDFTIFLALEASAILRLQHTLCHFLETRSVSHSRNLFMRFQEFHKDILEKDGPGTVGQIELGHLLSWKGKLNKNTVWKLGVVRILLEKAARLGFGICSAEALAWLDEASIPGNPKGVDVRTRDPNRGPFTAAEVETLNAALNDAYTDSEIDLWEYAAGHILLAFGIRSRQLAALKEKDLIVMRTNNRETRYVIKIPQAKQRGEVTRESFKARPCDRRLGCLLERLIDENRVRRNDFTVPPDEWPMFIGQSSGENPPGFAYHLNARFIGDRIRRAIESRAEISANAKRFRYTLAQNMADDGASRYEIAEALGHTDTQQVGIYIEARPEMVSRLNHLAGDFAPILQAFAGVLISRNDTEALHSPRRKQLNSFDLKGSGGNPLGHCGQYGFCDIAKPIGCYTCRSFRAWDDGPHEEMLAKLLEDRQRKVDRQVSPKIYTVNDRTIAAVTRVVQLCRQRRSQTQASNK